MLYVRLCKGLKDKGILLPPTEVINHINSGEDFYSSIYYYNEEQYKKFQETGTVKGIRDVITNKLVFDFDNEKDPDEARKGAQSIIYKLTAVGVKQTDFEIYFSGNKGFNVIVTMDKFLTPNQIKSLASNLGKDTGYDSTLYDAPQILREPGTLHPKSKLYKIPLTFHELFNLSIDDIKTKASNLDLITDEFNYGTVSLPNSLYQTIKEEKKVNKVKLEGIDFTQKPSNWKNCKWALLQGKFKSGQRHEALLRIAATCRGLGYDKDSTYYLCKSALKKQAAISGTEEFDKSELWNNIISESVFGDGWTGGQYSCKTDPLLKEVCDGLGEHKCKDREEESLCVSLNDMHSIFQDYAVNFEQNLIKIGIKELDDNTTFLASTLVGLLGAPGSGKTSFSINYLRNTSLRNVPSMFFSLDMGLPIVYAKLIQKECGLDFKTVMKLVKEDPELYDEYAETIKKEYNNVAFNFKSGLTVSDMKFSIKEEENKSGKKIKLVIIDYLECIAGPYSDTTANMGFIANQLKDMANELNVCVLLLLQTQKHSTSEIADPLLSLRQVKGSSIIEQSCSQIVTLWRTGYNPNHVEDDKYISFAVVKNRFGPLWRGDFAWEGVTGEISSMTEEQKKDMETFEEAKKLEKILEVKRQQEEGWS